MKFQLFTLAVCLFAAQADAVKIMQRSTMGDDETPEEKEEVGAAATSALEDLKNDVIAGTISEADAEAKGKEIEDHVESNLEGKEPL